MEHLRGSVNLRAYGQRDPLVEYKKEGLKLFQEMREAINLHVISILKTIETRAATIVAQEREVDVKQVSESHSENNSLPQPKISTKPKTSEGKTIGRNDPCPCGAIDPNTKKPYKWKKCGLIGAPYHKG